MPNTLSIIQNKLSIFLNTLGDEKLSAFSGGLCNAFAFISFRAEIIGEEDKNIQRIQTLLQIDEKTIQQMATSYKEYKKERNEIIAASRGGIQRFNKEIKELIREQKAQEDTLNFLILERKIENCRKEREEFIEKSLQRKFSTEKIKLIDKAKDLYTFIHNLVGAFDPGGYIAYETSIGKTARQSDFIEILRLFSPDSLLSQTKEDLPVQEVFEIAFNWKEKELIEFFSNQIHKNTIRPDDYIRLGSSDHAIYLSYKNGQFKLFDPEPIEIKPNTAKELVENIKKRFFTNYSVEANTMPIAINIFTKKNAKEKITRPTRTAILQTIRDSRDNKNMDIKAWDDTTACWMAARYGHDDTIQWLIEKKADINISEKDSNTSPLWIAARNGQISTVKILAEAKADINHTDSEGRTPVAKAAEQNHGNVIQCLHDCKADCNQPDVRGQTPLHKAVEQSHISAIKILIACGGKLSIKNNFDKLPIEYSNEKLKPYLILQMLKEYLEIPETKNFTIAAKQLERIKIAEINPKSDWTTVLKEVMHLTKVNSLQDQKALPFFQSKISAEQQEYLNWFTSIEKLEEGISKAFSDEKHHHFLLPPPS